MDQDEKKKRVAKAAIDFIEDDTVVGVGTGSTVNDFIDELANIKHRIEGAIASSIVTEERLKRHNIPVLNLNSVDELAVYVDGADEATEHLQLLKGGGGALTGEKIVATVSRKFVCIIDDSKRVDVLGKFPLPVEVLPMAQSYVAREILKISGQPVLRDGFTTDNGNIILDIHNLSITDPTELEQQIDGIVGVLTNGLFARRCADVLLVADDHGITQLP